MDLRDALPGHEGHRRLLSFYPDEIEVYEVDDAAVNPRHREESRDETAAVSVDDVVQHTDSGSGAAQRSPWPASVKQPAANDDGGIR